MKDKKVGDIIVFDYDVYDIVNNIESEYDHTDCLAGIVKEVVPNSRYTIYKVKLLKVLSAEDPGDYSIYLESDDFTIEASDDKVYRGTALFNQLRPNAKRPTPSQIHFIIEMYDPNKSENDNISYIIENWYKHLMNKFYDQDEFIS